MKKFILATAMLLINLPPLLIADQQLSFMSMNFEILPANTCFQVKLVMVTNRGVNGQIKSWEKRS